MAASSSRTGSTDESIEMLARDLRNDALLEIPEGRDLADTTIASSQSGYGIGNFLKGIIGSKRFCEHSQTAGDLLDAMINDRDGKLVIDKEFLLRNWLACFNALAKEVHIEHMKHVLEAYEMWASGVMWDVNFYFRTFLFTGLTALSLRRDFEGRLKAYDSDFIDFISVNLCSTNLERMLAQPSDVNVELLAKSAEWTREILKKWESKIYNDSTLRKPYITLSFMNLILLNSLKHGSLANRLTMNRVEQLALKDFSDLLHDRQNQTNHVRFFFEDAEKIILNDEPFNFVVYCNRSLVRLCWWRKSANLTHWIDLFAVSLTMHLPDNEQRQALWGSVFDTILTKYDAQCVSNIYHRLLYDSGNDKKVLRDAMIAFLDAHYYKVSDLIVLLEDDMDLQKHNRFDGIVEKSLLVKMPDTKNAFTQLNRVFRRKSATEKIEILLHSKIAPIRILLKCPQFAADDRNLMHVGDLQFRLRPVHNKWPFPFENLDKERKMIRKKKQLPSLYLLYNRTLADFEFSKARVSGLPINTLIRIGDRIQDMKFFQHTNTCTLFMAEMVTENAKNIADVFGLNKVETLPLILQGARRIAEELNRDLSDDVTNSRVVQMYLDQILVNYDAIEKIFLRIVDRICTKKVTPHEIEQFTSTDFNYSNFQSVLETFTIHFDMQYIENLSIEYHRVHEKQMKLHALTDWLGTQGIEIDSMPAASTPNSTLADLYEECRCISLAAANSLTQPVLDFLLAFLYPRSPIFDQVYENLNGDSRLRGNMSPADTAALVDAVKCFLRGLLEQNLTMDDLSNILDAIGNTEFEKMWNAEVVRITNFFGQSSPVDITASLTQTLNNIGHVKLYADNIDSIAAVVRELVTYDQSPLLKIAEDLKNYKQLRLRQLPEQLQAIRCVVGNLQPASLKYFELVANCIELVHFCRDPNFDDRLAVVRGVVQGFVFESNLLHKLTTVKTILCPILGGSEDASVLELCNRVQEYLISQADLDLKLRLITEVYEHLATLRDTFSAMSELRSIIPTIRRALYFQAKSHEGNTTLELVSENAEINPAVMIETRLQTVKVFLDDEQIGEERQSIDNFEKCLALAKHICLAFHELRVHQHPHYSSSLCKIDQDCRLDSASYAELLCKMKQDLLNWNDTLRRFTNKHHRLVMLTTQQISTFILRIQSLLSLESLMPSIVYTNVLPYALLSFPEAAASSFSSHLIFQAFYNATAGFKQLIHGKQEPAFDTMLEAAGQMLTIIEKQRDIEQCIATVYGAPSLPKLILSFDGDPWSMLRLHANICNSIPHPTQVLWADRCTTKTEVKCFLKRALYFNHLPFIIHGVNELVPSLCNYLSRWASKLSLSRNQKRYGAVYFVFTKSRGVDLFSFLEDASLVPLSVETFNESFNASSILQKRFIYEFQCLHSPEHDGKTTIIERHLDSYNGKKLRIIVNEDFTPSSFISKISAVVLETPVEHLCNILPIDVALHLDIGSYAPLDRLSRTLEAFFYWGLLIDPNSGNVLHLMDTIGQIAGKYGWSDENAGHVRWRIFVELSVPPANDKGFEHLKTSDDLMNRLPSIKHLKTSVNPGENPLALSSGYNLIARFECAAQADRIEPDKILSAPDIEQNLAVNLIDSLLHVERIAGWRFRTMYLSILADRCDFFAHYWTHNIAAWTEVLTADSFDVKNHSQKEDEWKNAVKKIVDGAGETYRLLKQEARYLASVGQRDGISQHASNDLPLIMVKEYFTRPINDDESPELNPVPRPLTLLRYLRAAFFRTRRSLADPNNYELRANAQSNRREEIETIEYMKFLCFGSFDQQLVNATPQDIFFCHRLMENSPEPKQSWAALRRDLAAGLKITRTERMPHIIQQQRYILTERFVAKLLVVHARHQTGNNLILVGDTGQGKTELLNLYALIVNADTEIVPNIFENISSIAKQICKEHNTCTTYLEHLELNENTNADLVLSAVKTTLFGEKIESKNDLKNSKLIEAFSDALLNYLDEIIEKFRLIIKTEFIADIAAKLKAGNKLEAKALIGEPQSLMRLLKEILNIRFRPIFHRIVMHKGITTTSLIETMRSICAKCEEHPDIKMVLFVDEFNTTSVMGFFKELLVDRMIDSCPLPKNLFVIAAMNPPMITNDYDKEYNFVGGVQSRGLSTTFAVRPPHPSMEQLMFHFHSLEGADEECFVNALVFQPNMAFVSDEERCFFKDIIIAAQVYVRAAKIRNMHPSIRDIVRAGQLFNFFRKSTFGATLLRELSLDDALHPNTKHVKWSEQASFCEHYWKALLITLAMGYSFRLETDSGIETHTSNRVDFGKNIQEILNGSIQFSQLRLRFHDPNSESHCRTVQDQAIHFLINNTEIPDGVAKTSALMENLFCIVVCVELCMPLTICGPPGCSKTLAYTIACENMKGPQAAPRPLYRLIGQMHRFRYQCSEMSTDAEIEGVFMNAIALQNTMNSSCSSRKQAGSCCVLLDEAGLPNEEEHPMKVLHHLQDHPQVASIVLTNKWLDPAKTNRTLQLLQTDPTTYDLKVLVAGCLFGKLSASHESDAHSMAIVTALCKGYQMIVEHHSFSKKFYLRDFVYFLRYLRRACQMIESLTNTNIMDAILRNFNGDLTVPEFNKLASFFFHSLDAVLPNSELGKMPKLHPEKILQPLRESLNEQLNPDENINTSAFRYICLLDPTDCEMSVKLLQSLNLCENCIVLRGSDFEEDNSGAGNTELISQMKCAMGDGKTVVLVAAAQIFGSFYDVFNKHFTVLTQNSAVSNIATPNAASSAQITKEYYANVAVGAMSRPCKVDSRFRVIVHMPISLLPRTPAPFLNRFEKFALSVRDCLDEHIAQLNPFDCSTRHTVATALLESCNDFVKKIAESLTGMNVFQSLVENETISSLVLRAIQLGTSAIPVPLDIVHVSNNGHFDRVSYRNSSSNKGNSSEWFRQLARQLNFKLMQLIRPEAIYESRLLGREYMSEYFLHQCHLSVVLFLEHLIVKHAQLGPQSFEHATKWCIFTRTSSELACLHNDPQLQQEMCAFVTNNIMSEEKHQNMGIMVRSLSEIVSMKHCALMIENFFVSDSRCLIVTADMSRCTHNQVNILRCALDEKLKNERLAIIIMHTAHEISAQKQPYPALFVEGWDFIYIDSLGFTEAAKAFHNKGTANERKVHVIDIDARKWLAHGYGFQFAEISPQSVEKSFLPTLLDNIAVVILNIPNVKRNMIRQLKYSQSVYVSNHSDVLKSTRAEALKTFFEKEKELCSIILLKFAQMWCTGTDEAGSLLNSVIKAACLNIRKGNVTGSLASSIQNSLQYMMLSIVRLALVHLLSNYNLETIAMLSAPENPHENTKRQFMYMAAKLIQPPTLYELFAASSDSAIVRKNVCDTAIFIPLEIQHIPSIPMYDLVAKSILTHIAAAQREQSNLFRRNAQQFCAKLSACIETDKDLCAVLKLLQNEQNLLTQFSEDFIHRTLRLPHLKSPWLDIVTKICHRLANSYSNVLSTVVGLFVIKLFDEEAISNAISFMLPLQHLRPPPKIEDVNMSINKFLSATSATSDEKQQLLEYYFGYVSVNLLWKRYSDCNNAVLTFEDNNLVFSCWCRALRDLSVRVSTRQRLELSLAALEKSRFYIMLIVYLFVRHYCLQPDFAVRFFADRLSDYISGHKLIGNVKDAINALEEIVSEEDVDELEGNKTALTAVLEDLILYFLTVCSTSATTDYEDFPGVLKESLYTVLCFFSRPASPSLSSLLNPQWLLATLYPLVHNKSAFWLLAFRNIVGTILHEDKEKQGDMDPFVPYISNLDLNTISTLRGDVCRPLQIVPELGVHPLEKLLFELLFCAYLHDFDQSFSTLLENYEECAGSLHYEDRAERISALAFGCVVLLRFGQEASVLSMKKLEDILLPNYRKSLRVLLRPVDVKTAWQRACPADGFCYFLQNITSLSSLNKLLQNERLLRDLDLLSWKGSANAGDRKGCIFRFLQNPKEPSHLSDLTKNIRSKLADDISRADSNVDALTNYIEMRLAEAPQDLYNVRFVLILVCYYDYFVNISMPIAILSDSLKLGSRLANALQLNEEEINALKFAANGPLPKDDHRFKVMELYSLEERKADIAHSMFNILAVAFGTPNGTNILNGHVFRPVLGWDTYGPGSAYHRQNIDCGFLANRTDELPVCNRGDPAILENVYRHRCVLNAMYWLSLVWSLEVNTAYAIDACCSPHFINAIGKELFGNDEITVRSEEVQPEHLKYYLFVRGQRFYALLPHCDILNMDAAHYFNEILLEIQRACCHSNREPAWRDTWKNIDEVVESENVLQKLFHFVENSYADRRKFFLQNEAVSDPRFELIHQWQMMAQYQQLTFLPELTHFQEALTKRKNRNEIDTDEYACIEFLEQLLESRLQLAGALAIPKLVAFFKKITEKFAYLLTLEETQSVTVPEAIRNCLGENESEEVINEMLANWEDFKRQWQMVRELVPQLEGCPDVEMHRAFELMIPEVNDDTFVACLLQHPNRPGEYDYIRSLLKNLINQQNKLLDARDQCRGTGQLPNVINAPWNHQEILFDNSDNEVLPLEWLAHNATAEFSIIVGDLALRNNYLRKFAFPQLQSFVFAHMEYEDPIHRLDIKFDYRRIVECTIQHYTCGRRIFESVESGLNMPFKYKSADNTATEQNDTITDQNSRLFGQNVGKMLRDFMQKLECKSPVDEMTKQNWKKILRMSQEQLDTCASYLVSVAARVYDDASNRDLNQKYIVDIIEVHPEVLHSIVHNTIVQHLYALGDLVLQCYEKKLYLFHQQEYARFEKEFAAAAERNLLAQRASILKMSDLHQLHETRKQVVALISDVTNANATNVLQLLETSTSEVPLVDLPHLQQHKQQGTFITSMLHSAITVENFTTYLRFLHCLLSDIDSRAQVLRERDASRSAVDTNQKYHELIPVELLENLTSSDLTESVDQVEAEDESTAASAVIVLNEPKPLNTMLEKATAVGKKALDLNTFLSMRDHENALREKMPHSGDIDWLDAYKETFEDIDLKLESSYKQMFKFSQKINPDEQVDFEGNTLLHLAIQHQFIKFSEIYMEKTKERLNDEFNAILKTALSVKNRQGFTVVDLIGHIAMKECRLWKKTFEYFIAVEPKLKLCLL